MARKGKQRKWGKGVTSERIGNDEAHYVSWEGGRRSLRLDQDLMQMGTKWVARGIDERRGFRKIVDELGAV
jgi:hypothetical protein